MNNILEINNTELESIEECPFCSKSTVLLSSSKSSTLSTSSTSSNFKDKEYFLYFQNNNLSLFEGDDIGMEVLDEIRVGYCMMCGRELFG